MENFCILIADDDLEDQELLKRAFDDSRIPLTIVPVYDGIQLLDYLYRRYDFRHIQDPPDLVILDLNMPLMDGFEALRIMKGHSKLKHIPVYVITTSRHESDKKAALHLGAKGYYSKGASFKEIQKIVKEVCDECFD